MYSERLSGEESLRQDFEALSVSKRLMRSVSQKLRKKNQRPGGEEEDDARGISLRCLTLYGRGGGCKVGADTGDDFGDPSNRRRSSASDEGKGYRPICGTEESGMDCFSYGMRREGSHQNPWLFIFGAVKDGYCSGEIYALDVSLNQWHVIGADILKGRFMFSVASIQDDIYIVGGCSSLNNFGRVDRSSFKTHKGVMLFSPLTKSWRKVSPMKYARSMPILGVSEVTSDFSTSQSYQNRQDRRIPRSRLGGVSDVYEDPHRLSLRRQCRYAVDENESSLLPNRKSYKFMKQKSDHSSMKSHRRFVIIAVGGLGSWDEPLDSGEIYDSVSKKWTEIQGLPVDFGIVCSGVVCNGMFYVYSESDKLAGYDIERGFWIGIQTSPFPPRVHEYYPKLVSCNGRLFMLSVFWCEGDGQIGRRNKAVRKVWELDLMYLNWTEVSVHPDAPMDWNAAFVADGNMIFGIEMFKIFGQVLDFFTVCDVSDMEMKWSHISRNHVTHELDASSCLTKSMAVLHLVGFPLALVVSGAERTLDTWRWSILIPIRSVICIAC
ncbi:F-box/kelch-repeat protein [Prunus yedoensis var. nudiflora]|uniref:F-box/kelch-repeat protein n=1 Tax=Prunus yedoensis var. nudiflora TaxID=2094558 RepID=A0A314YM73_PRUYE|nr:F-box/kelch-repeat protein [Prunus yedoensis var. nudiflora]